MLFILFISVSFVFSCGVSMSKNIKLDPKENTLQFFCFYVCEVLSKTLAGRAWLAI